MAESEEDRHLKLTGEFDCDPTPLSTLRHSTSHVMAQAVKRLFPGVKVAIGPAIQDGFYYDFARAEPFTPEDLVRIENGMREIAKANLPFERREMPRAEAIAFFRERGEPYKVEILEGIDADRVSLYTQGDFVDLCRGPHVRSTGEIKIFKLLSSSGAYWRGDEKNAMLQRIYGTAWLTQEELDKYLWRLEEAKKRDHRKLGRELDLFVFHDVSP
ncbi:MAG TPA: threonine--tRNA ligase, partial [Gemmatimonadales bacterium]|nr:threonine--tRNA ligase [Gemmatimonadales bacterium]